jgi:hypothetical protein
MFGLAAIVLGNSLEERKKWKGNERKERGRAPCLRWDNREEGNGGHVKGGRNAVLSPVRRD